MGLVWDILGSIKEAGQEREAYDEILPGLLKALDEQDRASFIASPNKALAASEQIKPSSRSPDRTRRFQDAIASIESEGSGGYAALGPRTKTGDRAYGRYQVMGANVPVWTREVLGMSLTPEQFLRSPKAQDAVFNSKFGSYVDEHGESDAASMWLTGRTLAGGGAQARDVNQMTGEKYAAKFQRALDFAAGGGPSAENLRLGDVAAGLDAGRSSALPGADIVPDELGGYVPPSNSRYDRSTGRFLTTGGGPSLPFAGQPQAPSLPPLPPITQPIGTMPSGQRHPGVSDELLIRALHNPFSAQAAQGLLMQRLKRDMQVIDIQAADDLGKVGTQKAMFDPHSGNPPIPFGPVDTSRARERVPTSVQEYEYGQAHPGFEQFKTDRTIAEKQRQLEAEMDHRSKAADRMKLEEEDRRTYVLTGRISTAAERPMTEAQANAGIYADRMLEADRIMAQPEMVQHGTSLSEKAKSGIPVLGNYLISPQMQQLIQAQRDFANAVLRKESGAAISQSEFDNAQKQYFPAPGDSAQVLAQKANNRKTAIEAIARAAGPTYKRPDGGAAQQVQPSPQGPTRQLKMPEVGAIWGGYRFKGGNPADKMSWERP